MDIKHKLSKTQDLRDQESEQPELFPVESLPQLEVEPKPLRLVSLDTFRGVTVFLMLLVNNIALDTATPDHLMHAPWNSGLRLADMVFPWFLFFVGVAIPFSASSFRSKELPAWRYDIKVFSRAATLVLLGCLINCAIEKKLFFSLGVLQVIGLAYLVGALLYELSARRRILLGGLMLLGYGFLLRFVSAPDVPPGTFEENRNIILHLNQTYLSAFNLEGLLSAVPTAALVLFGSVIGDLVRRNRDELANIGSILLTGLVALGIGAVWNGVLPYNKPVWTPSYILVAGGLGAIVLAVLYLFVDALGWKKWTYPFVVFGSNPILAYIGPIFIKLLVLQVWVINTSKGYIPLQQAALDSSVEHWGRITGGWVYTFGYIGVWWIVLFALHRKRIFLRV